MPMSCYCVLQYPLLRLQADITWSASILWCFVSGVSKPGVCVKMVTCLHGVTGKKQSTGGVAFPEAVAHAVCIKVGGISHCLACDTYCQKDSTLSGCFCSGESSCDPFVNSLVSKDGQRGCFIKTHSSKKNGLCLFILYLELILHSESHPLLILDSVFGNYIDTVDVQF